ncbi:MAG TPA: MoxR family ATPase [Lentisphaeria bacterium]|jgi:MoxR-like ATPase|nr:MoxR family ATPase [Lentisphaerota bacterium]NMA39318.1 MoxR family ATPase [Lentisphaerota bacterium]OQC11999.1 MAG: ATPase family associated with various cellular activities (AAA) [Lentisphaerae bacterium ADurb.Bin082]HQC52843.1 MoxR family ATPase [Lentisphaeria bacterium]HQL09133.1 MoxR family ATPase [Lentisphaeria bacterium]
MTTSLCASLRANLTSVMQGKDDIVDLLLTALLANGHVLLEDVPGVGKTTLAKALATSIQGAYNRIQFTPDMLPADITGGMIYSPKSGDFTFRAGPVFCNVLLGDEINRASPRTQSALLEAMSERQVSIEGAARPLPELFLVIATQNPIEFHGTYPLPEAQLDRFAMRLAIGYPDADSECRIVLEQRKRHPLQDLQTVATLADITNAQQQVRDIAMEPTVLRYLTDIVRATRTDPKVTLGASPRASLDLYRAAQARAFLNNRDYVLPDDIKALAVPVIAHRLSLDPKAAYTGIDKKTIVADIVARTKVPA